MDFLWFLHGLRTPALDGIFRAITFLGEEYLVVVVMCALYWCKNKGLARGLAISFFVSALLVQGLKIAVRVDRPWVLDPAFTPVASAMAAATGFSFPSGHTQTAASLFGYLGLASGKRRWITISWVVVALVALSRLYLGVHTPADVIAAMLISLAVSLVTLHFVRNDRPDALLLVVLAALSVLVISYALALHGRGMIDRHYLADCCKAAGGCIGCAVGFAWVRRRIPFDVRTPRPWQQVAKLAVGLAVVLGIKSGLKLILPDSLIFDAGRYFLIAVWALALYPLLFSKVFAPPVAA